MHAVTALMLFTLAQPPALAPPIATRFVQVYPHSEKAEVFARSLGQIRAVVLIHGYKIHGLKSTTVAQPIFHGWQEPKSTLVIELGKNSDVFAFAYGQNGTLDAVSQHPALTAAVRKLQSIGYKEIVLLGHSAGGVIARQFVEDQPDVGISRVIQVCPPNCGTSLAGLTLAVAKEQEAFVKSLSKDTRIKNQAARLAKPIPAHVEFVCVVGMLTKTGDGLVSCHSQWCEDLQRQGIPAVKVPADHWTIVRSSKSVEKIAELAKTTHQRLKPAEVETLKKLILP